MKRYFLILLTVFAFSACSLDNNDNTNYHFEYVPITAVDIPTEFVFGETYPITITYELPNSCYRFYSNDYIYDGTTRIIGTIAIVDDDVICTQTTVQGEYTIDVQARQTETYTFKFWQGQDAQGVDQYLIIDVPVI